MLDDKIFQEAWAEAGIFQPLENFQSAFLGDNSSIHKSFMSEDLARSGLKDMHINGAVPGMVPNWAQAGYMIPYCDLQGKVVPAMYRTRFKVAEHKKDPRYLQPNKEQLDRAGLPAYIPYIHPLTVKLPGEVMICAEGEKKTVSIIRHLGRPAFGIGGCQMWRNPDGSNSIHPWIQRLLSERGIERVLIVPDGDLLRYDICNAYGTFAHTLRSAGIQVEICNPPDKIDDLLHEWELQKLDAETNFQHLPTVSLDELVQSPAMLAKRYNLAFKQGAKADSIIVHQTTSNVMKLMEEHSAFPKVWRNLDNNRVYIGEDQATPDLTEMQIANYFQHNLGFEKVNHRTVYSCLQALAKQNQKSPFLEWIKSLTWDGLPRLSGWLTKYWKVEDTDYLQEVSSKWLISACARLDKPGTKVDWLMIVVGPQGVGKTSMPSVMFGGNSLTLYGESNDKDLHMKIHSALVIGFDELDSFGKKESSFLKAMVTTSQDHFRPPYGASVEVFDRRCTLYGCGNRYEFLQNDPSGYRRYAIVEVAQKLDFAGLEKERDQLWAEAWFRYQQGEEFWEIRGASEEAKKYVIPSVLEEKIEAWLHLQIRSKIGTRVRDGVLYFSMADLVEGISMNISAQNTNQTREIAAILRGMGMEKKTVRTPEGPRKLYVFNPRLTNAI